MPRRDTTPPAPESDGWPVATKQPRYLAQRPARRRGPHRLASSKTGWTVTRWRR